MKIDFGRTLKNLNGDPIRRGQTDGDGALQLVDWTIGEMAADALLAPPQPGNVGATLTVPQLSERYALALRLHGGGEVDLTAPEVSLIQAAVARSYPPLIAAQIISITDGRDPAVVG